MREQTARDMEHLREKVMKELTKVQAQTAEEIKQVKEQLHMVADTIASSAQTSPQPSYADVARSSPTSQPSNVRTLSSMRTTPSSFTDTLFCTIDTSRVIQEDRGKVQVGEVRQAIEEKLVKDAAEKTVVKGARVLRDQLYPVKVDGANRTAVLDSSGNVLPGAEEPLGRENEVTIAKMHWLSDKENGKMYGSMVIYVTKASDARRLLEERYFHLAGESASTNVFERRQGPDQCYNCWETGHKAFACSKTQRCGRCAVTGHRHRDCQAVEPKRQGEAGPIIDLMDEHGRLSLLPQGTKTWEGPGGESTIDLTLASAELADEMVHCGIHPTEHGSDHRAIQTEFDLTTPERTADSRLLFKNAPWNAIRERVKDKLTPLPWDDDVQTQTDRLMEVVLNAIHQLVPRTKPSPYAKRWWTADLTKLRRTYTFWRNLARARRRAGQRIDSLEDRTKEAAKEYQDTIRKQKKAHWDGFLADGTNIWQAAKYLKHGDETNGDKVPPLKRADGTTTQDKVEQAEELLSVFFPPLPADIEGEGPRPRRREVAMPNLTMEEVEEKVMEAKAWKAPGQDGLPAMVWKQLWSVVKERVLHLFHTSLSQGRLPDQWRTAKTIPLKKPGKDGYKKAKSWGPISLLSTLGKILEAVVANRISYAVETYGLLPTNHFGARKRRSAKQALLLFQEQVYKAWRNRKVVSLVSFDVKGAYNGVFKDRLLQRLEARGIPRRLVRWIDAFCSSRTATITVNGYTSALWNEYKPVESPLLSARSHRQPRTSS
ncbi:hypothetical protein HZS61_004587 [Fusarium oxysporum f. sp. conglutinans]|uniref:CCHC-type domain-containing protein n=1 Tax=Fusarium oxysporum f. sp. conglutinans TaxID=100902 RepID=A0A8H6GDV8_FUSOX|nr:hypothetical protein HZS61_004587 [Fusarium oxysporum f. sp. conglutinans]